MWSDEIDKKIRETTDRSHHAYDDKAWNKLEQLLDKHLPQKRRRRFIPLLLLPLALIGTGVFFALQKQSKNNIPGEPVTAVQPISGEEAIQKGKDVKTATVTPALEKINEPAQPTETGIAISTAKHTQTRLSRQPASGQKRNNEKSVLQRGSQKTDELTGPDQNNHPRKKLENKFAEEIPAPNKNILSAPLNPATDKTAAAKIADPEKADATQAATVNLSTEAKASKTKSSRGSNFSITLSAGPDLSSVDFDEPGEWSLQYGVGISYALSKKISLRTGFYTGRKIYDADPEDYHSDYNPPPSLQKIEANCLVYEIPVNLMYNFSTVKKHNWFVAGGLSSYLMKEETYDYLYKDPWGGVTYHKYVYKNENSHFFSVINLSGGYQYHFSDRFSLMAEPYLKIPLSGVGQGKVNLNSAGIMFTAGFKPFLKRN